MDSDGLKAKASELWEVIVKLETEKYDLEERQKRQDYDVSFDWFPNNYYLTDLQNLIPFSPKVERTEREAKATEQTEGH